MKVCGCNVPLSALTEKCYFSSSGYQLCYGVKSMRWNERIGRRIKLSDLHILLAVAQSGSMAKAASELAVSHPAVSRSISELEHTLGVRLLERNPRGIELTEYGRAMLNRSL